MCFSRNDQRCRGVRVTRFEVTNGLAPDYLTGLGVKGDDFRVKCAEVDLVTKDGSTTIHYVAARKNTFRQTCVVLPQFCSGGDVDCPHAAVGTGYIHDAIFDQWL